MRNPEKGNGIVFKDPYVAKVEWNEKKAVIRAYWSNRQTHHYFSSIELPRPIDPVELSVRLTKEGISEPEAGALITGIRQELSEI